MDFEEELMTNPGPLTVIIFTGSQYPGNLGTTMRSAAMLGIKWIAVLGGLKGNMIDQVFRAAQVGRNEQWDVRLVIADAELPATTAFLKLRKLGMNLVGLTDAAHASPVWDVDFAHERLALVFGKETGGIPRDAELQLHVLATVPQAAAGNLNVANAAAIVAYERHRQLKRNQEATQGQLLNKRPRTLSN
jgi:tRNA G18 (ribose-2'-O)-methylase SpoU